MTRIPGILALVVTGSFLVGAGSAPATRAQEPPPAADPLHRPFDQILDVNVRDGLVYYRALKSQRGKLDQYVASLNVPAATVQGWPAERREAFWLNAYNAFVLQTVVSSYPISGPASAYPRNSIRQIPGAFDKRPHRAAGRTVTLDQIENTILPEFKDPRLYLALGRGALGGGRLRSEAYTAGRLAAQLKEIEREFVSSPDLFKVDTAQNTLTVTPVFGWHEAEFIAAYDRASGPFAQRAPVERALIAFVLPNLFPMERELVEKNAFKVSYLPFDWRLNDLTGGNPR